MNLRECYMKLDGNYDEVVQRLQNEYIVEKFMFKFLKDKSFNFLKISIQNENYEDAHRYVHTIKGICQNLSFSKLYESSHQMTCLLYTSIKSISFKEKRTIIVL